jgi:hypothetical protein
MLSARCAQSVRVIDVIPLHEIEELEVEVLPKGDAKETPAARARSELESDAEQDGGEKAGSCGAGVVQLFKGGISLLEKWTGLDIDGDGVLLAELPAYNSGLSLPLSV